MMVLDMSAPNTVVLRCAAFMFLVLFSLSSQTYTVSSNNQGQLRSIPGEFKPGPVQLQPSPDHSKISLIIIMAVGFVMIIITISGLAVVFFGRRKSRYILTVELLYIILLMMATRMSRVGLNLTCQHDFWIRLSQHYGMCLE